MQHNVNDNIKTITNREDSLKIWGDGRKDYTLMKTSVDFTNLFQQHSEGFFFSPKLLDTLTVFPF